MIAKAKSKTQINFNTAKLEKEKSENIFTGELLENVPIKDFLVLRSDFFEESIKVCNKCELARGPSLSTRRFY